MIKFWHVDILSANKDRNILSSHRVPLRSNEYVTSSVKDPIPQSTIHAHVVMKKKALDCSFFFIVLMPHDDDYNFLLSRRSISLAARSTKWQSRTFLVVTKLYSKCGTVAVGVDTSN